MSDLTSETHRAMLLRALENAHPSLLREIFSSSPNEDRVLAGLKTHNDKLHDRLRQVAEVAPESNESSNVPALQPRRKADGRADSFGNATSQVTDLFRGGLK